MRNVNCQVLFASSSASQNGIQIDSNQLVSASFQFVFGDTSSVGTCKIQASNDICNDRYQANLFTVTNWTDIPNMSVSSVSGASQILTIPNCSYRWLRAVYTSTSGGSTTVTSNMDALSI